MSFAPNGTIYLVQNVPMDNTYTDTVDFGSADEQKAYFMEKVAETFDNYTYIRKDNTIRLSANIDSLRFVNYIIYCNNSISNNKWIYCFVSDKRYLSDNVTELLIETDVFQTYMFDTTWHESFIDREHQDRWNSVNSPIFNINDEGLSIGDEYIKERETLIAASEEYYLVTASQQLEDPATYTPPNMVSQYPTPLYYYVMPASETGCILLADNPAIVSISLIPFLTFNYHDLPSVTITNPQFTDTLEIKRIWANMPTKTSFPRVAQYEGVAMPSSFGVGKARHYKYESKLLTFPYMYNALTDYQTKPLVLKNEYLMDSQIEITVSQAVSHDIKTKYYVSSGYKGETSGKENCIINNTVNELPLITDAYKMYMLTHKAQAVTGVALGVAEGVTNAGLGLVIPHGGGMVGGGLLTAFGSIFNEMAKQKDLQTTPDSVRSMGNNIAFDLADGNASLKFLRFSIHENFKKRLGDYFAMFGYKSLEVKIPDLRSRYYYNYIKTIGCNIDGDFDTKDLIKLRQVYDNGVRIWHNRSGVTPLSYAYDNVEMKFI